MPTVRALKVWSNSLYPGEGSVRPGDTLTVSAARAEVLVGDGRAEKPKTKPKPKPEPGPTDTPATPNDATASRSEP